ncbi:MAG: HAD family phosphatase [Verrucomicrobiota bacterium]
MSNHHSQADFAAVIFDMDGVIVDSEPWHEVAFSDVLSDLGYGENHGVRFSDYIGRRDHDLWIDFIAQNRPAQSLDELLALKRMRMLELLRREQPVFPGLLELVKHLAAFCPLALASGSERPIVDAVLALRNLRNFFRVTISGSEIINGKPAPDIFIEAARRLGVAPQDCWVIEDSKPGVTAALAAGMRVIAITNTHPAKELSHATAVAHTYDDIARLLLGTNIGPLCA